MPKSSSCSKTSPTPKAIRQILLILGLPLTMGSTLFGWVYAAGSAPCGRLLTRAEPSAQSSVDRLPLKIQVCLAGGGPQTRPGCPSGRRPAWVARTATCDSGISIRMIVKAVMCLDTENTCKSAHLHHKTSMLYAAFTSLCRTDLAHAAFLQCLSP